MRFLISLAIIGWVSATPTVAEQLVGLEAFLALGLILALLQDVMEVMYGQKTNR